ncbi:putative membrane protein [Brevibacillus laterosporus GI-9]|nr:putative membrane protein [Brevibacillus laterosporus GI-9]
MIGIDVIAHHAKAILAILTGTLQVAFLTILSSLTITVVLILFFSL